MNKLILASNSPRRVHLLTQMGYKIDKTIAPHIDETAHKHEKPLAYSLRIAKEKALAVLSQVPTEAVVLAGDTTVNIGTKVIGKPENAEQAREILQSLSGRRHRVISSVCVASGDKIRLKSATTIITFKRFSKLEIDHMINSGEWHDKSGAYTILGIAGSLMKQVRGSVTNVVGLPMCETITLLSSFGVQISA